MADTATSPEPRWLDSEEQHAWRQFITGTTILFRQLERRLLERHDLSLDDYAILVLLSEAPDRAMRMSRLADDGIIARPHLTYRVTRLEKRGIVERCPAPGDARGVQARLTEDGFAVLEAAAKDHVASVRELVTDPLEREEFLRLGATVSRVRGALLGEDCPDPRRA